MTRLRWLAAGLFIAWMTLGPVYRQALGGTSKIFPAWHMYRGFGTSVWRVEIWEQTPEGSLPIDRLAWLGYDDWREAPMKVRRIQGEGQLSEQLQYLCGQLGVGTDLRVRAWRGRAWGWEPVRHGDRNVCR